MDPNKNPFDRVGEAIQKFGPATTEREQELMKIISECVFEYSKMALKSIVVIDDLQERLRRAESKSVNTDQSEN